MAPGTLDALANEMIYAIRIDQPFTNTTALSYMREKLLTVQCLMIIVLSTKHTFQKNICPHLNQLKICLFNVLPFFLNLSWRQEQTS